MEFVMETLVLLVLFVFLLLKMGTRNHDYWTKMGVPGPSRLPFFGTQMKLMLFRKSRPDFFRGIYESFPFSPVVGLIFKHRPVLFIRDPDVLKRVLKRDFEDFSDRGIAFDEEADALATNLFFLHEPRWSSLRFKLSPTFTSGKIKRMVPLIAACGRGLVDALESPARLGEVVVVVDIASRFTTDVIGSCAFGVDCNSLKNPDAEFWRQGMQFFVPSMRTVLRNALAQAFPKAKFLHKLVQETSIADFFTQVIKESIEFRRETQTKRHDFVDFLLELKNTGQISDEVVNEAEDPFLKVPNSTSVEELNVTDTFLVAQVVLFFVAGFETSASTMSYVLLELAQNPDIQETLQKEIDNVIAKYGTITYEAISDMTYFDKVVSETLRMYPPLSYLMRRANKRYELPVAGHDVVLEPDTRVVASLMGLHRDPAFFPDPERFDPERFSPEGRASMRHGTYMPFGDGPRNCIGMRLGLTQVKVGVVSILSQYSVKPSPKTKYPVTFKKVTVMTSPSCGCPLYVEKRVKKVLL